MTPPPIASAELRFRPASAGDYGRYAALFAELGVDDPLPDERRWSAELAPRITIAERAGEVLGYAALQILDRVGYLRQIVVSPAARRTGVGRALMHHLAERLQEIGAVEWRLNVRPDNLAARRLYEAMGLRAVYRSAAVRFPWTLARTLPAPLEVTAAAVGADDDAALEARFDIAPGLLADTRAGGRVLVSLRERGEPAGLAVFDPGFPGAFPFRVARPELAGALLAALAPHALADKPTMQVVCEDDPALVALLVGAGASVQLEMLHYRGALWV